MSPRNLLILFFSTVAVWLVILVIFFSLFFKNLDLDFNTKLPQSAPELFKRGNKSRKQVGWPVAIHGTVPPEIHEIESPSPNRNKPPEPTDTNAPPVSDDAVLNQDLPTIPPPPPPPPMANDVSSPPPLERDSSGMMHAPRPRALIVKPSRLLRLPNRQPLSSSRRSTAPAHG